MTYCYGISIISICEEWVNKSFGISEGKGIYMRISRKTIMDAIYAIPAAIVIITAAIGVLGKHEKINSFLKRHQWIYIVIFICLVMFAFALAFYSGQTKDAVDMVGTLEPASSKVVLLSAKDNKYPEIQLGYSGAILIVPNDPSGKILSDLFKVNDLAISNENGKLKVSAKVVNRDGVVASIKDNNWKVNPSGSVSYDRNYNNSMLEVQDKFGDIVLQIKLINDTRIQMQGKFYNENGGGVAFGDGSSLGLNGGVFQWSHNFSKFTMKIEPAFKYPSAEFLGVAVDQ